MSVAALAAACVLLVERLQMERSPAAVLLLAAAIYGRALWVLISAANPSLIGISLTAMACLLLIPKTSASGEEEQSEKKWPELGWVLLGLALALKPQVAIGPFALLFCRKGSRGSAGKAGALAICILVLAILAYRVQTGSFELLTSLWENNQLALLPGNTSDSSRGNPEYLTFLSIQAIPYFLHATPPVPALFGWGVTAVVLAVALAAQKRNDAGHRLVWTWVALAVLLSLLPVYHRRYDRLLAILFVPAVVELFAVGRRKLAWVVSLAGMLYLLSDAIFQYRFRWLLRLPLNSLDELLLCALLLWAMWSYRAPEPAHADAP